MPRFPLHSKMALWRNAVSCRVRLSGNSWIIVASDEECGRETANVAVGNGDVLPGERRAVWARTGDRVDGAHIGLDPDYGDPHYLGVASGADDRRTGHIDSGRGRLLRLGEEGDGTVCGVPVRLVVVFVQHRGCGALSALVCGLLVAVADNDL